MQTERQKEIIITAIELISKKGIQGLTIKNLSKEIGITEPAIYRHFDSKIQIMTTILDTLKQNNNLLFKKKLNSEERAIENIEQFFRIHFRNFVDTPSLTSIVFSEEIFCNESLLIKKIVELVEQNHGILLAIIRKGQENGEIRSDIDANSLVIMIMGSLRLFVKRWQFSEFSFDLSDEGEKIIQMVKKIILNNENLKHEH